jgi:hypothetical protein
MNRTWIGAVFLAVAGCHGVTTLPLSSTNCNSADARAPVISASNYDQSCKTDKDCTSVGEGNACDPCSWCPAAAINVSALSKYESDIADGPAGSLDMNGNCNCFGVADPMCCSGTCNVSLSGCPAGGGPDAGSD